jgi:hypothetical protein
MREQDDAKFSIGNFDNFAGNVLLCRIIFILLPAVPLVNEGNFDSLACNVVNLIWLIRQLGCGRIHRKVPHMDS